MRLAKWDVKLWQGHYEKGKLHHSKEEMQNSTKVLSNQIQQYIKMIICHAQVGFIPEMKSLFNIRKLMTISHYTLTD